jgi:PAS domain S-box-containing protein
MNSEISTRDNFQNFFEAMDDIIVIGSPEGKIIFANAASSLKLGYSHEEMLGLSIMDLHTPEDRDKAGVLFEEMLRKERTHCPLPLMKKDKSLLPVETRIWFGQWDGMECVFGICKDISAEQEALQKFHKLFDANPAPMALSTVSDRKFTEVNQAFLDVTGFTREDVIGYTATQLGLALESLKFKQVEQEIEKNGSARNIQMQIRVKDGRVLSGVFGAEIIESHGKQYFLTVMVDTTERKRQDLLQEVQRKITLAITKTMDMGEFIGVVRDELNMLMDTRNFYLAFYNELSDTITAPYQWDQYEKTREWPAAGSCTGRVIKSGVSCLLTHGQTQELLDHRILNNVGERAQCWLGVPVIMDNKTIGAFVVQSYDAPDAYSSSDMETLEYISGQISVAISYKEAEEKIRLLSKAVEQSPVSTVITDRTGSIHYVNPRFTELTGYSPEECVGQNPRILQSGLMDPSVYKEMWGDLLAGKLWYGEMHNRKKSGELFWEFCSISPITDETGEITHFVAVKEDITHDKNLIGEVIAARERAEQADRLKTAFLQNMSHEIRTPLNGIMGFSSLLLSGDFEKEEIGYYAGVIHKNSNRLLQLVNNIVDISKIDTGTAELEQSLVRPGKVLNDILSRFSGEMAKAGLQSKLTIPENGEDALFYCDASKLDQILVNLVSNAIKFTRVGSVDIGFYFDQQDIIFFVRDTGIGIDNEHYNTIFSNFHQVDNSLSRGYEGAGLGLAICKGYVDLMGGRIWLESEPGIGSDFLFRLPYRQYEIKEEPEQRVHPGPSPASSDQVRKILVAEDDVTIFQYLNIILRKKNFKVLHAMDGAEAVTLFKSNKTVDMVLMDMKMPVMDGFTATGLIRKMNPNVPIIAITAYTMSGDRERTIKAGCTDYLAKPIRREALENIVAMYF